MGDHSAKTFEPLWKLVGGWKCYGLSAYQYVIHCRMERAKHLLCRRDLSVAEVSQQVGFQNQGHFTNAFRKCTGTTPRMYCEAKK